MSFIRVLITAVCTVLVTAPVLAQTSNFVFPAGYASWEHTTVVCENGSVTSSQPTEGVEADMPNWVYRFQADGQDIAVVTWVGSTVVKLQTKIHGKLVSTEGDALDDPEALVQAAKTFNGFPSNAKLKACQRAAGYLTY